MSFYYLIKFILVILFLVFYFCDKNVVGLIGIFLKKKHTREKKNLKKKAFGKKCCGKVLETGFSFTSGI